MGACDWGCRLSTPPVSLRAVGALPASALQVRCTVAGRALLHLPALLPSAATLPAASLDFTPPFLLIYCKLGEKKKSHYVTTIINLFLSISTRDE